jgi:hypothetical protein
LSGRPCPVVILSRLPPALARGQLFSPPLLWLNCSVAPPAAGARIPATSLLRATKT